MVAANGKFCLFFIFVQILFVTLTDCSSPINPAYTAPSSGKKHGGIVVPWSEYRQKMENKMRQEHDESSQPVTIYLPPFKGRKITHEKVKNPSIDYERKNRVDLETNDKFSQESTESKHLTHAPTSIRVPPSTMARPGPTGFSYSTNTHKEPIHRPEGSFSQISRPPTHSAPNLRIPTNDNIPDLSSAAHLNIPPSTPIVASTNQGGQLAQYSKLGPAPFNMLSNQQGNLANSVFEQSQFRYSPQNPQAAAAAAAAFAQAQGPHPPAPLSGSIFNPGQLPMNENMLANLNPFQLLSTARDSPVEQIARIAKNLLSHENQQLFSSVANVLGGGKNSPLAGLGAAPAPEAVAVPSENLLGTGTALIEPVQLLSSSNKDGNGTEKSAEYTNAEIIHSLNALPEEQRKLLQAAINNGELDAKSLHVALNSTDKEEEEGKNKIIQTEPKLIEWIQQNRAPSTEAKLPKPALSADKLPYYGKYCGSFVEQINPVKNYGISGALWAVDNRRFIVSKFHYQPASISENVTFWSGPTKATGNAVLDAFPSPNGVFLRPVPIDISTFTLKEFPTINATIRHAKLTGNETLAEAEEDDAEDRHKRDLFSSTYEERIPFKISANFGSKDTDPGVKESESVDFGVEKMVSEKINIEEVTTTTAAAPTTTTAVTTTTPQATTPDSSQILPLEWYAGFQPLLLTLPEGQYIKSTHWVSLYDHKRQSPLAFVLIPNGNAFEIPSAVQLRPFVANGAYKTKSGPIHILDTKTIQVTEFSLETGGIPVWFMVGKEVLPNGNGHIVPVFDRETREFDCMSLRDYKNETITLRLPGALDIKDVFWFSIFSIPQAVSMANMYLPYNDMHLPPDLDGLATPACKWSPVK